MENGSNYVIQPDPLLHISYRLVSSDGPSAYKSSIQKLRKVGPIPAVLKQLQTYSGPVGDVSYGESIVGQSCGDSRK